jgi:hypothetical protein
MSTITYRIVFAADVRESHAAEACEGLGFGPIRTATIGGASVAFCALPALDADIVNAELDSDDRVVSYEVSAHSTADCCSVLA